MLRFFIPKAARTGLGDPTTTSSVLFESGVTALEWACVHNDCTLRQGAVLPAVVLDASVRFGMFDSVARHNDGTQLAYLRVASSDGGFIVAAQSASSSGPHLIPGQLVIWWAGHYSDSTASRMEDERCGWVGLIIGTLKSEWHHDEEWVVDEKFEAPDHLE